jgi:hypothetical protein
VGVVERLVDVNERLEGTNGRLEGVDERLVGTVGRLEGAVERLEGALDASRGPLDAWKALWTAGGRGSRSNGCLRKTGKVDYGSGWTTEAVSVMAKGPCASSG